MTHPRIQVRSALARVATSLALAVALAAVCTPEGARADDESTRKTYLASIESKLGDIGGYLSGFENDSDASDLDRAWSTMREVEELVDDLDDVKGDDSQARDVVSYYPRYISDWYEAAGYLRRLKDKQRLAPGYVTSCKAWDEAMRERARNAKDDPNAADDLSTFAKSVGRQGEDLMNEAKRARDELNDAAGRVDRFSVSTNNWAQVSTSTRNSGSAMMRNWDRDYQEAVRACEEVVKRERHRAVEEALGRLANSSAGRKELMAKISELLGVVADRVNDVASQSSDSNVGGAIEVTREIASQLDRLRSAQGDDQAARKIADEWPRWNEELRLSLEGLRAMKQRQRLTDAGAEKCAAAERELQELIKSILETPTRHAGGAAELEQYANRLRETWQTKLDAAAQGDRELNEGYAAAVRFDHDGPWATVRDRIRSSATGMRDYWNDKYGAAKKACEPLALGRNNRDVDAAISQLGRNVSTASERSRAFYAELRDWEAQIATLRDWTAKDVEDIRQAFCRAPDAGEYREAIAVADRWADQLRGQYGTIVGRAAQLKQAADALIALGRSRDRMEKVKAKIDATLASIDKVRAYQLEGSNNPLFKARTSYGVDEHNRRQGSCSAKEILIRGDCDNPHPDRTDCKIDCMKGCTLIEIKPKSQATLGELQARAYLAALQTKFARDKMDMFKQSGLAYFEQCVSSDKSSLQITTAVDTYDFCEGITLESLAAPVPAVDVATEASE